jgi:formamidopyrimidine-DNA glycosylase
MPELPEVETIARRLRHSITGKRIAGVCLSGKPLRRPIPRDLAALLKGRMIRTIHRRGKYLILELTPHAFWLIHLGMSGRLFYATDPGERRQHTHASIQFTDGDELQFCDPRRFGLMDLYQVSKIEALPEVRRLGMDPMEPEFDGNRLWPALQQSRREIKAFLLDQSKIAGLGNIYACEAMYHARIHPGRRCNRLSRQEAATLAFAIRRVLQTAIRNRGTSFSDFKDSDGEPGTHQRFLHVFQREGERCRRCRCTIGRTKQANRSTYFCPGCQPRRPGNQRKKG